MSHLKTTGKCGVAKNDDEYDKVASLVPGKVPAELINKMPKVDGNEHNVTDSNSSESTAR